MKLTRKQATALGLEAPGRPARGRSAPNAVQANRELFLASCKAWGLPEPLPEVQFHPDRRWRFDWLFNAWLAVEIQGGLFSQGRHVRGAALVREYEKINEAQIMGYTVLLVTPQQVKDGSAFALIKRALGDI